MARVLLITGATGNQGGALLKAITSSPQADDFKILAVTRNPDTPGAQKVLNQHKNVSLVKGNLNDVPSLFQAAADVHSNGSNGIWGVYSVQVPMGQGQSPATEEAQGKALVDEAVKRGVKHFVYSSVDRGGDEKSWDNPTPVPHFVSKHNIEHHLREQAASTEMTWTILRPVAFIDGLKPGFFGKMFATAWREALGPTKPLQFVAVKDIGHFAAQAFMNPSSSTYKNKAISLAGDEPSFQEANKVFQDIHGQPLPTTFGFLANTMLWGVKEMGLMVKWFHDEGYGADIARLRSLHPDLTSFKTYMERDYKA